MNNIPESTLRDLWKIRNPHLEFNEAKFNEFKEEMSKDINGTNQESFPLTKRAYFELTSARNRNLILPTEQAVLRKSTIAFFGLSVGSHAACSWMMISRALNVILADPDTIDATNLNRLYATLNDIGKLKTDVLMRRIMDINPFCNVFAFSNLENKSDLQLIFDQNRDVSVIVEETDSFDAKVLLRKIARDKRIPLISAADVGDNIIVDIERYDIDPATKPFLGRVKNPEAIDFKTLSDKAKKKLIIELVGFEANSERMIDSLIGIGGSIVSWPQLGSTAQIAGGVVANILKNIILKENIRSGRYFIDMDKIFKIGEVNISRKRNKIMKINEFINK